MLHAAHAHAATLGAGLDAVASASHVAVAAASPFSPPRAFPLASASGDTYFVAASPCVFGSTSSTNTVCLTPLELRLPVLQA